LSDRDLEPSAERGDGSDDRAPDPANALALAYRAGRTELLPALFEALRPVLQPTLRRYRINARSLPAALEPEDLVQQTWLILDRLARRWDPTGGDFGAYVRTTFPWALWRYIQYQSPGRRARAVRVDNVQHHDLLDRFGDRPGTDGRAWDDQLIAAELLDELDPLERRAFLLHRVEERTLPEVAQALRLTSAGAYRTYRRALDRLRLRAGLEIDAVDEALPAGRRAGDRFGPATSGSPGGPPGGATSAPAREYGPLERLVEALHAGAGPDGRLPGRGPVCAHAGLSEVRFARLMRLLVERGCVVDRSARRPGRLVHATPAETLAHLERARVEA
jgi:RNA polymerase sigma factor (sigma-70 family)